jgi:hypothetical protein
MLAKFQQLLGVFQEFRKDWRRPIVLLLLMQLAVPVGFATWTALINNFSIERAAFTGVEIGFLQSLREVPGFLTVTIVFVLLLVREQTLAVVSICLLGIGVALTGFFPTVVGLYLTTVLMSTGAHYYAALRDSLAMQWSEKEDAPLLFGQLSAVKSFASLLAFVMIYLCLDIVKLDMTWVYLIGGGIPVAIAIFCVFAFPRYPVKVEQNKQLVLRPRYWLFYALTMMYGARRQVFMVFASFMMVEKFGFTAAQITLMFLFNALLNMIIAPKVGRLIAKWGERKALTLEYIGLICVFVCYAFVEVAWIAVALYIIDHMFFALGIAIKTYFQKIADPADIASTQGVSYSINHIIAIGIPAAFGFIWLVSPAAVFLSGAAMAAISLVLARLIPHLPGPDNVAMVGSYRIRSGAAAE